MENQTPAPFVADGDPAFQILRIDVRRDINEAEETFRKSIADMGERLRAVLPHEMADSIALAMAVIPAEFIHALLPFFQALSEARDQAEILMRLHGRRILN